MLTRNFTFKKIQTLSGLFTSIFKNDSDLLSKDLKNFLFETRDQILERVISLINLEQDKDPSLWGGAELRGNLWTLLSLFRSCKNFEQIPWSRRIRPALLNLQNSVFSPLQLKIESSLQQKACEWSGFLHSLQVFWEVAYEVHTSLHKSGLLQYDYYLKWIDMLGFLEKTLFIAGNSNRNILFSPFDNVELNALSLSIKANVISLCLLIVKIYTKNKRRKPSSVSSKAEFFRHKLSNITRMLLNSLINLSQTFSKNSLILPPEQDFLSSSLYLMCISIPFSSCDSLPELPLSLVSNLLLPLCQFPSNSLNDNPTDQLIHLRLLAFSPQKEPSLQGVGLFSLKSLCTSVDSFCSKLVLTLLSNSSPSSGSLLLLAALAGIIKPRPQLFSNCQNYLESLSSRLDSFDELTFSCFMICISAFAKESPQKFANLISGILQFSFSRGALARLVSLQILQENSHSCSSDIYAKVFPSLLQCLNTPPFEAQVPETIALLLPLSIDFFQKSPNFLQSLISVSCKTISCFANSLSPHTVNRLLTILRFTTENEILFELSGKTI